MTGQVDEAGREQRWPAVASWEDEYACHGAHQVQLGHWTMEPHHFGRCHSDAGAYIQRLLEALRADRDRLAGQVAAIRAKAEEWAAMCPDDDWPENGDMSAAVIADAGRIILRLVASSPTTPEARK